MLQRAVGKITKEKTKLFALILLLNGMAFAQQSQQEQRLVQQLNQSRAEAGLPPLRVDDRLTKAARVHSQRMIDARTLGHVLPGEEGVAERLADTGLHFGRSGENVGYNSEFDKIQGAFMKSPPHRANILSPDYNLVGIGLVRGEDGLYWATQDFAYGLPQRTVEEAEDLVAQSVKALNASIQRVDVLALRNIACSMASKGTMQPQKVMALPGVHYAITYSNTRPEELPDSAKDAAQQRSVAKFAVGVCEGAGRGNPGGTYYVVMAFY